ncbi:MAG TPA: hypothetical protein VKB88_18745 [Bryobacteraceae bacterium]|nr:hypothetical protein [Bryobacteraceae bacterium]
MRNDLRAIAAASVLTLGFIAVSTQGKDKPAASEKLQPASAALLWREPRDIASRNLFYGSGGERHVPHGTFTFQEEDLNGTSPKFDVVDEEGVRWRVKMGIEARPETAASRLLWAVGYFTSEDYFMPTLHVEKMQHLRRGNNLVSRENNVSNVRLKRHWKDEKKVGIWSWAKDPFTGTREWYGLRVMMAVMNNWDLKDANNAVYRTREEPAQDLYIVSDLGGSFGPTGLSWNVKGDPAVYCSSKWIKSVSAEFVSFNVPSAPALGTYINFTEFGRMSMLWLGHHIPRQDARWIGDLLSRLSAQQIHDAFRAAGYSPTEVEDLSNTVARRIADLEKL